MLFFRKKSLWLVVFIFTVVFIDNITVDKANGQSLANAVADPRTLWYNRFTLPEVQESSGTLFYLGYDFNVGQADKTGSTNNEHPWLHTGGLDKCGDEVTLKRLLWIPPETKIDIFIERKSVESIGLDYSRVAGTYPEGTISAEFLYEKIRLFEIRVRQKKGSKWETDQLEFGKKPVGYKAVDSCIECHEDIGKHAKTFDVNREWHSTVRGLEVGGPIQWHPWSWKEAYTKQGRGSTLKVRPEVQHLINDRRSP